MGLRRAHNRRIWQGLRLGLVGMGLAVATWMTTLAAQAADTIHVVAPGENLARIAASYGLSPAALSQYNALDNPDIVWVGQQLLIPTAPEITQSASMQPLTGATTAVAVTTNATGYTPPAEPALPNGDGYYVVATGDSLSRIAVAYGMQLADMMRLNGLANADQILVGQRLRVTSRVEAVTLPDAQPKLADAIYIVQTGDSLASIARQESATIEDLMRLNGLPNPNMVWVGQRLRVKQAATALKAFGVEDAPADGARWIEIDLGDQTLTAWQGDVAVLRTLVSTGKPSTPTVTGEFAVQTKLDSQRMTGDDYDLPNVPWVMYFYSDFAIHGAYWHANFGNPTSHGCINMIPEEAKALYDWAPIGTQVVVHY